MCEYLAFLQIQKQELENMKIQSKSDKRVQKFVLGNLLKKKENIVILNMRVKYFL